MRRILAVLLGGALTVAGGSSVLAGTAFGAVSGNLVVNGDAETGLCTTSGYDAMTVPGWTVAGGLPDTVCYGTDTFPSAGTPGPAQRGKGFFAGGATGDATLTQTVDVSAASSTVDGGGVGYTLSGWLGGWSTQDDRVGLTATFRGAGGTALGSAALAPVTKADRGGNTALLQRTATGTVPAGTRTVQLALTFVYVSGSTTDGYADNLSLTVSTPVPVPVLAVPGSYVPRFDHVFFVFMENENYSPAQAPADSGDWIVGNPAAPYLNGTLAPAGALLSEAYATTHPSDPNYLAVSGGSTFGWSTNPTVGVDRINAVHLGDRVEAAGGTWKGYADGMSGSCDTTSHNTAAGGYYLPDAEPFMLYADVINDHARCAAHNQPLSQLFTDLGSAATTPNLAWVGANDYDDMESGGVSAGDTWLRATLPRLFASPAWTTQRSLLIVSWDEGYTKAYGPSYPNQVATYLVASQGLGRMGYTSRARYSHFSLTRTVDEALRLSPLTSNDKYATPVNDVWTTGGPAAPPNLVDNGDAEAGGCSTADVGAPSGSGWTSSIGTPQQVCYGSAGFPTAAQGPRSPDTPGNAFFSGGQTASAALAQSVDVSASAGTIDSGRQHYTLSGWLGGYANQDDGAGLVATFLDGSGRALGSSSLAPVLAAQRGNTTGLVPEASAGTLPAGTRSVRLVLTFTRTTGTDNDGYADDLSLVLG